MIYILLGIFIGITLCYLFIKYIEPIFNIKLDIYQIKQNDIVTKYHLSAQELALKFFRKYPEAQQISQQQNVDAMGYMMSMEEDDSIYFEDGMKKRKIGFKL